MSRLPAVAIDALADLVAAGYRLVDSLEALPRHSLPQKAGHELDLAVSELRRGAPLEPALERLGLEITSVALRGARSQHGDVEAALRADAGAQRAATDALSSTRSRVRLFALILAGLVAVVVWVSMVFVPKTLRGLTENLPDDMELPPTLIHFEAFRNLWLTLGAATLLLLFATVLIYGGLLGRRRLFETGHDLRLQLPFLRVHAIHGSSARLLEALAHEQAAGIPANATVKRVQQREKVPRLRQDLKLAAARLDAGDPWETCLRGTLFDTPLLADLAGLAGRGAQPTSGWQWGAARSREAAIQGFRRAVITAAAVVLVPSFLYMLVLLQAATVTVSVAQVETVRQQIELLTDEVERLIPEGQ